MYIINCAEVEFLYLFNVLLLCLYICTYVCVYEIISYALLLSHQVMSDSLWPHGLQHARLPCPSPSPGACSNSCPLRQWWHPTICRPLLLPPSIFPSIQVFSKESALRIRWPKNWSVSLSISPCHEYSGLISFRTDWFDLLAVHGTFKSLLQHHSLKTLISP